METIILRGGSEANAELILQLARKLDFPAKKLSLHESENINLALSVVEGIESGILDENEKNDFLETLRNG